MRLATLSLVLLAFQTSCTQVDSPGDDGWGMVPKILERIIPPEFPDRDFLVTEFGATGNETADCTEAFAKAVAACAGSGGGRVIVPAGVYLTGPIHLKSNVNLHVEEGATIRFKTDSHSYLPVVFTRWEGVECMNYSPLIYAYEQENIAITGKGTLDGGGAADNWWWWNGKPQYGWKEGMPNQRAARSRLFAMAEQGLPVEQRVMGEGSYLRPNFFQPYKCKNILVEGVTFKDSPMWFLHPVLSENITIRNVTVQGLGPNNDGCNPESSRDVLIKNCYFNTGDDCIAIKSGRNADGRRINVPTENVIVQDCTMKDGHGGVVMGSEMTGGIRNVFAERCTMDSPNLDRALRIKTNAVRGGFVENVYMRDVTVGELAHAVVKINFFYEEGESGPYRPSVRNIRVKNVRSNKSPHALWIRTFKDSPATDILIEDCEFNNVAKPNVIENVNDLRLVNVRINGLPASPDGREQP